MTQFFRNNRSSLLLVALLVSMLSAPLSEREGHREYTFLVTYLVLALTGAYVVAPRRNWFVAYCVLALSMVVLKTLAERAKWAESVVLDVSSSFFTLAANGLLLLFVIDYSMVQCGKRRVDRIIAGVCGYLVVAFISANLMRLVEDLNPGSFTDSFDDRVTDSDFTYTSLVTITTLGYGDVLPVTRSARLLCGMSAVAGALYIGIFISSLIAGMRLPGDRESPPGRQDGDP
jgi:hypothetical protein